MGLKCTLILMALNGLAFFHALGRFYRVNHPPYVPSVAPATLGPVAAVVSRRPTSYDSKGHAILNDTSNTLIEIIQYGGVITLPNPG